ncbi:tetratricopeptide repeat protein [Streptomyces sp. NPDC101181]|uniref:tetratricopeptide repeat protein n=1 Tax=Streptomyces sp. NPDC101181 TaxID=3366125 RepID=UPI00380F26BA
MHEIRTGSTDGARADFEKMLAQLASTTNPNVRMIAANPGDWGIDAFAGDLEGVVTVWQSKYFMPTTTTNHSQQIRESLASGLKAAAVIGYTIERWILCIPSSMDGPAAHWWDGWKKRQEQTHDITVELWDETELIRRLQSPTGDQVRRAYYEPFTMPAASAHLRKAFQQGGHAPPERTTALLPQASGLPREDPGLQPEAIGPYATRSAADNELGPGTLIDQWSPYDLEVHPAGPAMSRARSGPQQQILPGYVRREHDHVIAEAVNAAVAGQSRMVVLVGSSSTGKTRACWEAIQPLAKAGWRLWHPFNPTRAEAALAELEHVRPQTVVWLNEGQHYLGDARAGEQIAAAVHDLLTNPGRGPILVLGTLWPEYARKYTALPAFGDADPHSRARELLAGRTLTMPEIFDTPALSAAAQLAKDGDRLLAEALTRTSGSGRVAQDLAGAPELLRAYEHGSPAAQALLEAAMDARRLGIGPHLPVTFLTEAAHGYLDESDLQSFEDDNWVEAALAELAQTVHGKQAALRRVEGRSLHYPPKVGLRHEVAAPVHRLADYLEQHGRSIRRYLCPPTSFWHAAFTWLTLPGDLSALSQEAEVRFRLRWAHLLRHRAAQAGSTTAILELAFFRDKAGDPPGAEELIRQASAMGSLFALEELARRRSEVGDYAETESIAAEAANRGNTRILIDLGQRLEREGDCADAERIYRRAVDAGEPEALVNLSWIRHRAGDQPGAANLCRQADEAGYPYALRDLALMLQAAGDNTEAEAVAHRAASRGNRRALNALARTHERNGDCARAERLYKLALDAGDFEALGSLARLGTRPGGQSLPEEFARRAADSASAHTVSNLVQIREQDGDRAGAERLAHQAAINGKPEALMALSRMRRKADGDVSALKLATQAADFGSTRALYELVQVREQAGDRTGAERLAYQAADAGDALALRQLAELRLEAGDRASAETLARQAADIGLRSPWGAFSVVAHDSRRFFRVLWPHGLDPDGTPSSETPGLLPRWSRTGTDNGAT